MTARVQWMSFWVAVGVWWVPHAALSLRVDEVPDVVRSVSVSVVEDSGLGLHGVLPVVALRPPPREDARHGEALAAVLEEQEKVVAVPQGAVQERVEHLDKMGVCPWKVRAVIQGERSSAVFVVAGDSRVVHMGSTLSWKGSRARVVGISRLAVWVRYKDETVRCVLSSSGS